MENIKNSKSNLARLMATENIFVEHHNIKSAYFDIKNRVLGLPIWKNMSDDLYDLFVGHEVGHALYTPLDTFLDAIDYIDKNNKSVAKGYLNVVEDARIEKLIKRLYPGLKKSFLFGYKELINRDFFELTGKNIDEYSLIDRLNLHFKCGVGLLVKFNDEEKIFVSAMENCETFEDAKKVAKRIYDFCKTDNKSSKTDKHKDSSSTNSGDTGDSDKTGDNQEPLKTGGNENGAGSDGNSIVDGSVAPQALTDETLEKMRENFVENTKNDILYLNIPENIHLENIIEDHKLVHNRLTSHYKTINEFYNTAEIVYNKFRLANEKVVSYMVREFEMKKAADEYSRANISRTGILDTQKLHSYKYNEDLFKKITTVTGGKNHGLVMFIDFSGSMHSNMADTIDQLLTLVSFCRKVNIPFEVYSFTDSNSEKKDHDAQYTIKSKKYEYKNGDIILSDDLRLCNYFSSRMTLQEYRQACVNMTCLKISFDGWHNHNLDPTHFISAHPQDSLSGTPLNDAIVVARHIVPKFRAENNIQIVNTVFLTDGSSNRNNHYSADDDMETISQFLNHKTIIRDTITRKWYENTSYNITDELLNSLRDLTKTNVIGFFITSKYGIKSLIKSYLSNDYGKTMDDFKINGFIQINNAGYDPYFVIDNGNMEIDEDDFEDIDVTKFKGVKSLAKKFTEYSKNKIGNRVIAGKFIERIAKDFS